MQLNARQPIPLLEDFIHVIWEEKRTAKRLFEYLESGISLKWLVKHTLLEVFQGLVNDYR